jgi:hypothetical protein
VLTCREPPVGPASRPALTYVLTTTTGAFDVYAAGVEATLSTFEGSEVVVRGKLVDLSLEGHGEEIWIGSIRAA